MAPKVALQLPFVWTSFTNCFAWAPCMQDYMAPEVLRCPFKSRPDENKDNVGLHYGARVDAWAVGVLTFELLVGAELGWG